MNGYILLHKSLTKWEWYSNINTARMFIHLLLHANFEDKQWRGITIKRGELVTSLTRLSQATNLSLQQTRNTLTNMQTTREITCKTTNRYTVISIKNYDQYQTNNTPTNTKPTRKPTTIEVIKEINKKESVGLIELFNKEFGKNYTLTEKRRRLVGDRLKAFGLEQLERAVRNAAQEPFYRGKNDRGWQADPDYLFRSDETIDKALNLEVKAPEQPKRMGIKARIGAV